ncbi:MAG TPA: Uma2 family endonuclease [Candidatus Xenobia bacterium]
MTVQERTPRRFTSDEYLTLERSAESKSEWIDGEIFAMGGGTPDHSTIKTNIAGELHRQLKGTGCRVYDSDMKVRVVSRRAAMRGLFTYPDVTVVCGEPQFHDTYGDILVNPKVLFEVLSPSTNDYDRGQKRLRYQAIPSLSDYCIVAQSGPRVEHWLRSPDGTWAVTPVSGLGGSLVLASIDCGLPLSDIYDRIQW